MYKYRITKYNPIYRDPEGKYTIDDWTAISDIGKVFNNQKLTIESYKNKEDNYIKAIYVIMDFLNLPYLTAKNIIRSLSDDLFFSLINEVSELYTDDILDYYSNTDNVINISYEDVDRHCRLLLREDIGSDLFYHRELNLFIGYDFLMGVHSSKELDPIFNSINELGLFIEEFK